MIKFNNEVQRRKETLTPNIMPLKKIKVIFTPHLIPTFRGILSTMHLETNGKNNAKKIYEN